MEVAKLSERVAVLLMSNVEIKRKFLTLQEHFTNETTLLREQLQNSNVAGGADAVTAAELTALEAKFDELTTKHNALTIEHNVMSGELEWLRQEEQHNAQDLSEQRALAAAVRLQLDAANQKLSAAQNYEEKLRLADAKVVEYDAMEQRCKRAETKAREMAAKLAEYKKLSKQLDGVKADVVKENKGLKEEVARMKLTLKQQREKALATGRAASKGREKGKKGDAKGEAEIGAAMDALRDELKEVTDHNKALEEWGTEIENHVDELEVENERLAEDFHLEQELNISLSLKTKLAEQQQGGELPAKPEDDFGNGTLYYKRRSLYSKYLEEKAHFLHKKNKILVSGLKKQGGE